MPEQDNLRAALDRAPESGEVVLGLRVACALEQFWIARAPYEGRRRIESLLSAAGDAPPLLRARALRALGGATYIVGEFARGTELHEQSLAEFRALGDELAVAHLAHRLAGEAMRVGDLAQARALSDESLATQRRHGSPSGEAMALGLLGAVEAAEGRVDGAIDLALRSAALAGEVGFIWWQVHQLYHACEWSFELRRVREAEEHARAALQLAHQIQDRQMTIYTLALLARAAAMQHLSERAGRLWGAIEIEEARGPVGQWETEREDYATPVLRELGPDLARGRATGRGLSLDEAVEHALAGA